MLLLECVCLIPDGPARVQVEEGGSNLSWPASESLTVPLSEEEMATGTLRVEVWNKNKLMVRVWCPFVLGYWGMQAMDHLPYKCINGP